MTLQQFENNYWYAIDLKKIAKSMGIPNSSDLRKDQLEKEIIYFLKNKKIKQQIKKNKKTGSKDYEIGLSLKLPVLNYTSNSETKKFLLKEALKIVPNLCHKSGSRYWLNRWREDQIQEGHKITYGDLVKQFIKLNQSKKPFARIPSTRFNNFISDYLKFEKGSTKSEAQNAWEQLKKIQIPKVYPSWKKYRKKL